MVKIVLITGANKGIGYHTARFLLENAPEFDKILITARNKDLGLAAKESFGPSEKIDFHVLDVTSLESIQVLKDYVLSTYGHLDVLVNNAAISIHSNEDIHLNLKKTLTTNFYGLKIVTEAFLPLLEPNGHAVQVSSLLGKTSYLQNPSLAEKLLNPELTLPKLMEIAEEIYNLDEDWAAKGYSLSEYGNYNHSKALVNAYTRIIAKNLQESGSLVRVNAVHPGWVKTDMGGPNAPLSIDEGIVMPTLVIRDTSNVTGKYWADNSYEEVS